MFSKEDIEQGIAFWLNYEFPAEPVAATRIKQLPMAHGDRFEMEFGATPKKAEAAGTIG